MEDAGKGQEEVEETEDDEENEDDEDEEYEFADGELEAMLRFFSLVEKVINYQLLIFIFIFFLKKKHRSDAEKQLWLAAHADDDTVKVRDEGSDVEPATRVARLV